MATNETAPALTPTRFEVFVSPDDKLYLAQVNENGAQIKHVCLFTCDDKPAENAAIAEFIVRVCNAHADLRRASQELYDRLQEYLDVSDDELIEQGHECLVEAMDDIEAAWRKADGTVTESADE